MVHLLPMNFTPRAPALLAHLGVFNPFALQFHQTARTHYYYNPLYEGYHTLFQPGDCTSSLIMAAHKLVFLGDLDVEDASFIQLLGFAKVGTTHALSKKKHLFFNSKIHPKRKLQLMMNLATYTCTR